MGACCCSSDTDCHEDVISSDEEENPQTEIPRLAFRGPLKERFCDEPKRTCTGFAHANIDLSTTNEVIEASVEPKVLEPKAKKPIPVAKTTQASSLFGDEDPLCSDGKGKAKTGTMTGGGLFDDPLAGAKKKQASSPIPAATLFYEEPRQAASPKSALFGDGPSLATRWRNHCQSLPKWKQDKLREEFRKMINDWDGWRDGGGFSEEETGKAIASFEDVAAYGRQLSHVGPTLHRHPRGGEECIQKACTAKPSRQESGCASRQVPPHPRGLWSHSEEHDQLMRWDLVCAWQLVLDSDQWVKVSQHDYWMLLISIGHIVLEILGTLVVGLNDHQPFYAEIDSSLLVLKLWASRGLDLAQPFMHIRSRRYRNAWRLPSKTVIHSRPSAGKRKKQPAAMYTENDQLFKFECFSLH